MNILLADDSETIRVHFSELLSEKGFTVTEADSGDRALSMVKEDSSIELVLLDCNMPGLQGAEVCRAVRALPRTKYVYIVLFTASGRSVDVVRGLEAGADDFILKSCEPEELIARLQSGLRVLQLHNQMLNEVNRRSQSQRLESIGHISTGLAHQLNTPVQYVIHNMEFLREEFSKLITHLGDNTLPSSSDIEFLRSEIPACLQQNIEGLFQIRDIVGALRDFSQPPTAAKSYFNVNTLILNVIAILGEAGADGTTLSLKLGDNLPMAYGYQDDINHILMHLIVNAREAVKSEVMTKPGRVVITTTQVENTLLVTVEDNGCGIEQDLIREAFDPFTGGGGLYFAKTSLEQKNGGSISLSSSVGVGTSISFTLPISS